LARGRPRRPRARRGRVDEIETALVAAHSKVGSIGSIITFDAERQVVTVASDAPETAFEDVIRRYGAEVEYLPGGAEFQSRTSDSAPHFGGAAIRGKDDQNAYAGCTAGFAARDSGGHNLMVTAGHCFKYQSAVANYKLVNGSWTGGGSSFGTVTGRSADADDEEITGSTHAGWIYTSATAVIAVSGAAGFTVGATYCVSGAYSVNASCGHADVSNSARLCPPQMNGGASSGRSSQAEL
jgi:hypothetical protein